QVACSIAYTYGWRMQSEVLTLERHQIDLTEGTIRLDPGSTKNGEGRVVYLGAELKALVTAQLERVAALERRLKADAKLRLDESIAWLFPHLRGADPRSVNGQGTRLGARRDDFRKSWLNACREAGVAGKLIHDFRRTAVRNMVNAGVPERVAMTITGHKT